MDKRFQSKIKASHAALARGIPRGLLPSPCPHPLPPVEKAYDTNRTVFSIKRLHFLRKVTWFYPLYVFSIILSNIWYNDIAKYGFSAMGRSAPTTLDPVRQNDVGLERPAGVEGVMIGIGEQVYSLLLLNCFFLEVYVTGYIPYVGKAVNFLLLSWMYAYYCFEYKWNFTEVRLEKRLDFFESNWAFFAGFGSPCVLPVLFFSPLVSYGFMAILFPLFVLTATGSEAEQVISSQRTKWGGAGLRKLPIFNAADKLSMRVLSLFPLESQELLQKKKDR
ncbi:protein EI24 homolog isoform X2 [Malus domestica]|uniref:protein EI24 homolog isoform X2 n=1 Tax=Malus domestica TaxID=3750 RepID=UPI003975B525